MPLPKPTNIEFSMDDGTLSWYPVNGADHYVVHAINADDSQRLGPPVVVRSEQKPLPDVLIEILRRKYGKFLFQVNAVDTSDHDGEKGECLLVLKRPFWNTWWFWTVIVLLAVAGASYYIYESETANGSIQTQLWKVKSERDNAQKELQRAKKALEIIGGPATEAVKTNESVPPVLLPPPSSLTNEPTPPPTVTAPLAEQTNNPVVVSPPAPATNAVATPRREAGTIITKNYGGVNISGGSNVSVVINSNAVTIVTNTIIQSSTPTVQFPTRVRTGVWPDCEPDRVELMMDGDLSGIPSGTRLKVTKIIPSGKDYSYIKPLGWIAEPSAPLTPPAEIAGVYNRGSIQSPDWVTAPKPPEKGFPCSEMRFKSLGKSDIIIVFTLTAP